MLRRELLFALAALVFFAAQVSRADACLEPSPPTAEELSRTHRFVGIVLKRRLVEEKSPEEGAWLLVHVLWSRGLSAPAIGRLIRLEWPPLDGPCSPRKPVDIGTLIREHVRWDPVSGAYFIPQDM